MIEQELNKLVESLQTPGIAYMAVTADTILCCSAAGVMDSAGDVPVKTETQFMAASTTKAVTAILVMRLVEKGLLNLDIPFSEYDSSHPYGDGITLRMLLGHTAGVPGPPPLDWFFVEGEKVEYQTVYEAALHKWGTLKNKPNEKYLYSNLGYWLVEKAVEKVTEKPFAQAMQDEIFLPLGIQEQAGFDLPSQQRLATGHLRKWSIRTPIFYMMTPGKYWTQAAKGWSRFQRLVMHGQAYGGLFLSPAAFAVILQDLLKPDGQLLSTSTKETMFEAQHLANGRPSGDALGWNMGTLAGQPYLGKQGGGMGFFGNVRIYPEAGVGTVYFANATRVTPEPIDKISDVLDRPFVEGAKA